MSKNIKEESTQSHSLIIFDDGPPYTYLGWQEYKQFNGSVNQAVSEFEKENNVQVYVCEQEILTSDRLFFWWFSFFEDDEAKRDQLSKFLHDVLYSIFQNYSKLRNKVILYNHDCEFFSQLSLEQVYYYSSLVNDAHVEIESKYSPPKEKSYKKKNFDLERFKEPISFPEFRKLIKDYIAIRSNEDVDFMDADDGYFTNKYRSNKYLREEFIPLEYFLSKYDVPEDAMIHLGVQSENYDAKLIVDQKEIIFEITMGAPKDDYLYWSLVKNTGIGGLPLKTLAKIKKEIDSLPERIELAINKKHKKEYGDDRFLLVVIPGEYVYQGEQYIIDEVFKEISCSIRKGGFRDIFLMFGSKIYSCF